jgi:hypothetical protein
MGSEGIRVGRRYYSESIDDFHLIVPRFDTRLENRNTGKVGSYQELLIDRSPLQARDLWNRLTYDRVYGACTDGHFRNLAEDAIDKKVLILTDSMGKVVAPFLILVCRETLVRYDTSPELLEAFAPDFVIDLRFPANADEVRFPIDAE